MRVYFYCSDDPFLTEMRRIIQELEPYTIFMIFDNTDSLKRQMQNSEPDILFLKESIDVSVFYSIHEEIPYLPIIIISNTYKNFDGIRWMQKGAWYYITPDNLEHLRDLLKEIKIKKQRIVRRLENEKFLETSANNLREIFDTTQDILIIVDTHTDKITTVNNAVKPHLGYEANELIGNNYSIIIPRGIDWNSKFRLFGGVFDSQKIRRKDGTVLYMDMTVNMILWNDRASILLSLRDVTERINFLEKLKASETRFSTLFNLGPNLMCLIDLKNEVFTEVNQSFLQTLGYEREEVIGESIYSNGFIQPGELIRIMNGIKIEGKFKNLETKIHTKDNITIPYLFSGERFTFQDQELVFLLGNDITIIKETESKILNINQTLEQKVKERTSELEKAKEELLQQLALHEKTELRLKEALQQEKEFAELQSRFISLVSHEFRTPLTIIFSSSNLILEYRDKIKPEKMQNYLLDINSSVKRLTYMLDEIIFINRMEVGKEILHPQQIALDEFIQKRIEEINMIYGSQRIMINTNIQLEKRIIWLDERLLEHIFVNLLSNAVKYSKENGNVIVNISTSTSDFIMEFIDFGIGIPEYDQQNLFQRFIRGSNVGNIKGTGLGLTIVRNSVELLNGTIRYNSKQGDGTTFTVWIPLKESFQPR